jgi:hypothetical protein
VIALGDALVTRGDADEEIAIPALKYHPASDGEMRRIRWRTARRPALTLLLDVVLQACSRREHAHETLRLLSTGT